MEGLIQLGVLADHVSPVFLHNAGYGGKSWVMLYHKNRSLAVLGFFSFLQSLFSWYFSGSINCSIDNSCLIVSGKQEFFQLTKSDISIGWFSTNPYYSQGKGVRDVVSNMSRVAGRGQQILISIC